MSPWEIFDLLLKGFKIEPKLYPYKVLTATYLSVFPLVGRSGPGPESLGTRSWYTDTKCRASRTEHSGREKTENQKVLKFCITYQKTT